MYLKCSNKVLKQNENSINIPYDIIITSANAIENGFFSLYIIKELLEQSTRNVYCMVEENVDSDLTSLLEKLFSKFEIDIDKHKDRIIPIQACYYKPNFGLDDSTYQHLSEKIDLIIHNAANFNNLYDYSMLRQENVLSIDEILKFANCGRYKSIHYINSIVVNIVRSDGSETLCSSVPDQLTTGYFTSRIAAEIKIKNAINNGFDINVYRHPKLLNTIYDSQSASKDEFLTFVKFCLQNNVFPDFGAHYQMWMLRVNNAAEVFVNLIFKSHIGGIVYNISNVDVLKYTMILEWLKKFNPYLKEVSMDEFKNKYLPKSNATDDYHVFKQHFESFSNWGLFPIGSTAKQVNIVTDNTVKLLGGRCYQLLKFTEHDLNAILNGLNSWLKKE